MRNYFRCLAVITIIILGLCGCGNKSEKKDNKGNSNEFITDTAWQDNSLNRYSATGKPILFAGQRDTDMLGGGVRMSAISMDGVAVLESHLYEESSKCFTEIMYIVDDGQVKSVRMTEGTAHQAWGIGGIIGSNHYVVFMTGEAGTYYFTELDKDMQEVKKIPVNFLSKDQYELPSDIHVDKEGCYHMITTNFETGDRNYYINSSEGELLKKVSLEKEDNWILCVLSDGRIGLQGKKDIKVIQPATGTEEVVIELDSTGYCCTDWDDEKVLIANREGLYLKGRSDGKQELLYRWMDHGISVSQIEKVSKDENQGIRVIYIDAEGRNYIYLKPTEEDVEIKDITFAISPFNKYMYEDVALKFNKEFPSYRIKLVEYQYEDQRLLSEITAGKGPVLIDAGLLDFEGLVDYWESLDEVVEQMEIKEELIEKALELGKVDGKIYGIVPSFSIKTVLTAQTGQKDWDYEDFISCIEDVDSFEAIFNGPSLDSGIALINNFFIHGMEDSFLWDLQSKTVKFDSQEFRSLLKVAKEYQNKKYGYEQLMDGTLLCLQAEIDSPQQIAFTRVLMGEDANYIGYPSGEGASHYLSAESPVVIRASATKEERKAAHTFLKMFLGYDMQMDFISNNNEGMSIRKDVLEWQIENINTKSDNFINWFPQITLEEEQLDIESDRKTLYELIEKAKPERKMPRDFLSIMVEELDAYFNGGKDEDTVIKNLSNRVLLYLSE